MCLSGLIGLIVSEKPRLLKIWRRPPNGDRLSGQMAGDSKEDVTVRYIRYLDLLVYCIIYIHIKIYTYKQPCRKKLSTVSQLVCRTKWCYIVDYPCSMMLMKFAGMSCVRYTCIYINIHVYLVVNTSRVQICLRWSRQCRSDDRVPKVFQRWKINHSWRIPNRIIISTAIKSSVCVCVCVCVPGPNKTQRG